MNKLQKALGINALFSGISGLTLTILHQWIARLFGVNNSTVFWIIGLALLFFAGTIVYEILKQRQWVVWWIIIQDFLWVIGSFVLLLIQPFAISQTGNMLILLVAVIVLFMGINQYRSLPKNE